MLKNLCSGLFRLIAATALIINLVLLSPFSQPGLAVPLSIAASPEQPPVTPANPQPSGTAKTQDKKQETAESQAQRPADRNSAQDSTSEKEQSKPAAPYDMEAVKAFNRALYGS